MSLSVNAAPDLCILRERDTSLAGTSKTFRLRNGKIGVLSKRRLSTGTPAELYDRTAVTVSMIRLGYCARVSIGKDWLCDRGTPTLSKKKVPPALMNKHIPKKARDTLRNVINTCLSQNAGENCMGVFKERLTAKARTESVQIPMSGTRVAF